MAIRSYRISPLPISSRFWCRVLALGLVAAAALGGPVHGQQAPLAPAVAPTLGWLGGEGPSGALRADRRCNAAQLKRGPLAKVGRHLAALYCNGSAGAPAELTPLVGASSARRVVVDAVAAGEAARLAAALEALGARAIAVYGQIVSAQVPVARLGDLAALPDLRWARPASARAHAGTVTGQHVAALEIAGLAADGLDGSGVSIGVLSDSYDCLGGAAGDIAGDDLPAGSTALLDEAGCGSGTDEGRAMMQLIHDVAPAADLTFHTAFGGQATFANGIEALRAAGATVIVDDVTYFAEPMFQDGILAQAVDQVSGDHDVAYFSSAGNHGDLSYESDFADSGDLGPFGGPLHDFDPGPGVDTAQQITVPTGTTDVILNWDQPYFSATGGAGSATDLDIHVYDGATYLFSAATDNLGGDPIEILSITNTGAPTSVNLVIEYFDGPSFPTPEPTFVKYVVMNDATIDEYATQSGTAFGHANSEGAITVGAANYWQTPAYGADPAQLASYSSHGGVTLRFDLADQPIAPLDRGKPEVVGPDGANTTFFGSDIVHGTDPDTFPNFFGTSASAPAVAALGAMMQQAQPTLRPAEIEACLTQGAADMGAAGFDSASGHGWVRAEAALACAAGDWGDLPDSFATRAASGGAAHFLVAGAYLGAGIDSEADGSPSNSALGDDAAGGDEDGVVFLDPIVPSHPARIQVTASQAGYLNAWIDFDGSLAFEAGEQVQSDLAIGAGSTVFQVVAPADASGVMYSRFRFTTDDPAGALGPGGAWPNGEVEDYALAALGNRVWSDDGAGGGGIGDGLQNGSEPGLAGATVRLRDGAGAQVLDAVGAVIETTSDGDGLYEMPGLPPGSYRLEFEPPGGASGFSPADAGDDALDSDPDVFTGQTVSRSLTAGQYDDTVDAGIQAPTVALVSEMAALRDGREVWVEWETAAQTGTLAFELYRRAEDGWRRVNDEPVAARPGAPQGGRYRLRDATAPAGARRLDYALAEIESGGRLRLHGPWAVAVADAADATTPAEEADFAAHRRDARRGRRVAGERADAERPASRPTKGPADSRVPRRVKVEVGATGLVALGVERLAEAFSVPPVTVRAAIRRQGLRVSVGDREVAWHGDPGGSGLIFYAEHQPNLYAEHTVYRVEIGRRGAPMAVAAGAGLPVADGWFEETRRYEEDLLPAIAATEESDVDFWHWKGVMAGHPTLDEARFELEVPGLVPFGEARLTVRLVGGNRGPVADEQWAEVEVDGEAVGTVRWNDKERIAPSFVFDPALLSSRTTVTVRAREESPGTVSFFFIEGFELDYRRRLEAAHDRLRFVVGSTGAATVAGFTAGDLVAVDVSDPDHPRWLAKVSVDFQGSYRGTISAPPGAVIEMARRAALPTPGAVEPVAPSSLATGSGAEYLIIAPHELVGAAAVLADYRESDGLTTMVADLEAIYDEFSASQPTPWAVRDFLRFAAEEWPTAPRYVVLTGAGTFDPRDILGFGDNLITPLLIGTPHGLAPADSRLADLTGDGVPDLALGRIPVLTASELAAYVDKVRDYEAEAGPWRRQGVLLADDRDSGGDFAAASDELAADLPATFATDRVYLDRLPADEARARTIARWRSGALLVNYFGHGGSERLAVEGLLRTSDVEALESGARSPIVAAMTCVVARFDVPDFDSLGERLVLAPGGGAIALWAPSGLSTTGTGRRLDGEFTRRLLAPSGTRLGDATLGALTAVSGSDGNDGRYGTYTLLGDPALRVVGE